MPTNSVVVYMFIFFKISNCHYSDGPFCSVGEDHHRSSYLLCQLRMTGETCDVTRIPGTYTSRYHCRLLSFLCSTMLVFYREKRNNAQHISALISHHIRILTIFGPTWRFFSITEKNDFLWTHATRVIVNKLPQFLEHSRWYIAVQTMCWSDRFAALPMWQWFFSSGISFCKLNTIYNIDRT